jgi:hypothetical protein
VLADADRREPEGSKPLATDVEDANVVIPTSNGTSFCDLAINNMHCFKVLRLFEKCQNLSIL